MPRYYFDLDECGEMTVDEEGVEFADEGSARAHAVTAAREIMAAEIKSGRLCLACALRVRRAAGDGFTVWFREAVTFTETDCSNNSLSQPRQS